MPTGWKQIALIEVCEKITKGSTPTSYGFSFKEKGINFIKTENINEKGNIVDPKHFIDEKLIN